MSTWKMLSSAIFVFVGFLSGASATLTATSEEEFDNIVNTHPHTLVVFSKESGCPECRRYEEFLLENLEEMEESYQCSLTIVRDNAALEKRYGFESTPRIMFFRDGTPAIYHAKDLDVSDLFHWIHAARESRIYTLDDSTFEWSTQASSGATNGDWLVVFTPDKTLAMMAKLEGIGVMAHPLATVVGLVDYTENENLKQRFSIEKDTVLFIEEKGMRRFKGEFDLGHRLLILDDCVPFLIRYGRAMSSFLKVDSPSLSARVVVNFGDLASSYREWYFKWDIASRSGFGRQSSGRLR